MLNSAFSGENREQRASFWDLQLTSWHMADPNAQRLLGCPLLGETDPAVDPWRLDVPPPAPPREPAKEDANAPRRPRMGGREVKKGEGEVKRGEVKRREVKRGEGEGRGERGEDNLNRKST